MAPPAVARAALREQQQALAREHVLDAAEAVVAERGLRGTTLREVAKRAEYSVGALYQFFEGKDELLTAVLLRRNGFLVVALQDAIDAAKTPLEALHAIVDVEVDHFRDHPGAWRLFEETLGGGVNLAHRLDELGVDGAQYRRIMALHERVLRDGAKAGVVVAGDRAFLATMLAAVISTYLSALMEGGLDARFSREDLHALVERTFRSGRR
jgi:AcrR family transcriptional regulator